MPPRARFAHREVLGTPVKKRRSTSLQMANMPVLHFRVTSRVIGILCLIILLVLVGIAACTKDFKLGQKRKVINGFGYVGRHIRTVAFIVCVLGHGLHHRPQVGGERRHQRICHWVGSAGR